MYKIVFISRKACFLEQNLIPEAEIHNFGNTTEKEVFKQLLLNTFSSPPNILLIHPPSGLTVEKVINFLNRESNFSSRTEILFFTSDPNDIAYELNILNSEAFQVSEDLLELIWKPLIKHRIECNNYYSLFDGIHDSIIYSIKSSNKQSIAEQEDSDTAHHRKRNRYGPREVLRLAQEDERYINKSTDNLSYLLRKKGKERELLKGEPGVPLELLKNIGPGISPSPNRVLLVDDEHSRGWSTVFGALIFGRTDERVYKVTPEILENLEIRFQVTHWNGNEDIHDATVQSSSELKGELCGLFAISIIGDDGKYLKQFLNRKYINENQKDLIPFDIILLDYRICAEGREVDLQDISGYKMSSFIHNEDPSVPIIIVSASNKIWTLLTLQSVGAWDYYLKPNKYKIYYPSETSYAKADLEKFMNRLTQASVFSSWARTILIFAEFLKILQIKVSEKTINWKDFPLSQDPLKHQKEYWSEKINTMADTIGYVAENLNEFSRLGLLQKSNEIVEERVVKLNRYLLAIATDSISVINTKANGTLSTGSIKYFNYISKAYRNVISHSKPSECIPAHIHLLIQIISVVGLLPESITKNILLPQTSALDLPLDYNNDRLTEKFFLFIKSNQNNDMYFPIKNDKKKQLSESWFSELPNAPDEKLRGICKITKDFRKTTWISFVAPMLMILNQTKFVNLHYSNTDIESFNQLLYRLYGYAANALIEKNIEMISDN